jgi:hypothetical protein
MSDESLTRLMGTPLEHGGWRVVTLPQVDEVHDRPRGTAKRNFRRHRRLHHLVEGVHFFEVTADEIRPHFGAGWTRGGSVVLLTERGYLMLVKSFTDDLSWKVQDRLVEGYFARPAPSDPFTGLCSLLAQVERQRKTDIARLDGELRELRAFTRAVKDSGRRIVFAKGLRIVKARKPKAQLEMVTSPKGSGR